MDEPGPERLPCGCCGRCLCGPPRPGDPLLAGLVAAFLALLVAEVALIALVLLGGEFAVLATLTAGAAVATGPRAARTLWGLARVFTGMGLGTVAGCGIAALLLLIL